jgi:hypothetical protein
MTRWLYRLLLLFHPPAFRRRYGPEMLWIFDETALGGSPAALIGEAAVSVLRQWVLRTRLWIGLVSIAGALLTMLAGNASIHFLFHRLVRSRTATPEHLFLIATALSILLILMMVIAAVLPLLLAGRRRA